MTNPTSNTTDNRRDEILNAALREQALAHRGRRVLSATASVALIAVVAGVVAWQFLPINAPISPAVPIAESPEDAAIRDRMASQPRIATPGESNRRDPRFRLIEHATPRMIVERAATTPGLAKKYASVPARSSVARATDDDLALALHATNPASGLVRMGGQLFAANGGTLVRPEDLPASTAEDGKPQSMLAPRSSAFGV